MNVPEPITVREAKDILGCTRSHVFTLIHRGELSYKKQGKRFTLRRDEVERMASGGWLRVGEKQGHKLKVLPG
jgi:excisionase family DNA binding protein